MEFSPQYEHDPFEEERELGIEFEEEHDIAAGHDAWLYEGKYMIDVRPGTRMRLITEVMNEDGTYGPPIN